MRRGRGFRLAQPYTATSDWVNDSHLACHWSISGVFEHSFRSVEFGPVYTSRYKWFHLTDRFEWEFNFASDVGELFRVQFAVQLKGHGPTFDMNFVVVDSAGNRAGWFGNSSMVEVDWEFGNRLRGPWSFVGNAIYTNPQIFQTFVKPVRYAEEFFLPGGV